MKSTFVEKFAKTYQYPYMPLSGGLAESQFEQIILGKRKN